MFLRRTYADLQLNVNGHLISGVQSFEGAYQLPNEPILSYGGGIYRATNENVVGNITFERLVVGESNLFSLVSGTITGHLYYQTGYFGFTKGCVNAYRVAARVNDVPTESLDFTAFGNVGSGVSVADQASPVNWMKQIVTHGDVDLAVDGQETTNRVVNFDYTIGFTREPRYNLGEKSPSYVLVRWPAIVETTFSIDVDTYQFQEISGAVCSPRQKDLILTLRSCGSTGTVLQLKAPKSRLISESVRGGVGGNMNVTATYRAFINQFSELL